MGKSRSRMMGGLVVLVACLWSGMALAASPLLHNSANLPNATNPKWGGNWGVTGGQYGEFTCATCHNKTTTNVKRVVESIPDTIGPNVNKTVTFKNMTAFGNDSVGHNTSVRICEVCHTQTKYHQYNTANAPQSGDLSHPNGDCIGCHPHSTGFKPTSCSSCHGHNAASSNPIATGQHSAHINNLTTLGTNYSCADCHAPTVSSDTVFSAPTNHQNGTVNYGGTRAGSFASGTCTSYCHTNGKGGAAVSAVNWTSGPALDCKGCHGGAGTKAGEPTYASTGAGSPGANSHGKHVSGAADCVNCHVDTTTSGTSVIGSHTNQSIDVRNGGGKSFSYTAGSKTCSTSSCHSGNGIISGVADAQWGATLDCNGCHSTSNLQGAHNKHLNAAIATPFTCNKCHVNTADSNTALKSGTTTHMNAARDINFDATNATGSYASPTCSSLYCHSDGSKASGYTSKTAAPTWSAGAMTCTSCHGGPLGSGAFQTISTGRHTKHLAAPYKFNCSICHASTVTGSSTILDPAKHVNAQINVSFSGLAQNGGATPTYAIDGHAPGYTAGKYETCNNMYCHSNGQINQPAAIVFRNLTASVKWGGTKGLGCSDCHGGATSTGTYQLSGKHLMHTRTGVANTTAIDCYYCHQNGGSSMSKANHLNGMANYSGVVGGKNFAGRVTLATGVCSAVYCHSDGKGNYKDMTATGWFSAATLNCTGCHGGAGSQAGEPVYTTGNSHVKHVGTTGADTTCQNCHRKTVSGAFLNNTTYKQAIRIGSTSQANLSYHANGNIDVASGNAKTFDYSAGTCSNISCHNGGGILNSVGSATWGSSLDCSGCHTNPTLSTSHAKHIGATIASSFTCDKCHSSTATSNSALVPGNTTHMNAAKDVAFDATNASGSYTSPNCSNLYCHSYGTTTSGQFTVKTVPTWGGAPVNCYSCHGSDSTTGQFNNMSTGRHKKHMVGQYSYGCAVCHSATVSSNDTVSDPAKHVNVQIDVSFSGVAKTGGANALYTNSGHAPGQPGTVNDSCQNVYCHSNAQVGGQAGTQLRFRNLTGAKRFSQTVTVSLGCNGCHSTGSTTSGQWILSGKHLAHVSAVVNPAIGKALACTDCHANGGSSLNKANHANAYVNYSGALSGNPASLNLATGVCATAYCHSDGRGNLKSLVTDNWFSATNLDCTGCHGGAGSQAGEPVYTTGNSHVKHVGTTGANATCQNCHASTVTGTGLSATTTHVNKSIEVLAGNGKSFTFSAGGCSNISCHSTGTNQASANWGATLDCEGCHPTLNLSAGHSVHISTLLSDRKSTLAYSRYSANASSGTTYKFGCANCHPVDIAKHLNGAVDVDLTTTAGSGSLKGNNPGSATYDMAGTKQCSNVYCHSNGYATNLVYAQSPAWTGNFSGDKCAACHGNSPSTTIAGSAAHAAHVVGIHTTNIFSGTSGKLPQSAAKGGAINAAHGTDSRSTTLNCNICHNDTVQTAANDDNTACVSCHTGATKKNSGSLIGNTSFHVNGQVNVKFADTKIVSKAQLRGGSFDSYTAATSGGWARNKGLYKNYTSAYDVTKTTLFSTAGFSAGNCSNVACHAGKPVSWTATTINCDSCHTRL